MRTRGLLGSLWRTGDVKLLVEPLVSPGIPPLSSEILFWAKRKTTAFEKKKKAVRKYSGVGNENLVRLQPGKPFLFWNSVIVALLVHLFILFWAKWLKLVQDPLCHLTNQINIQKVCPISHNFVIRECSSIFFSWRENQPPNQIVKMCIYQYYMKSVKYFRWIGKPLQSHLRSVMKSLQMHSTEKQRLPATLRYVRHCREDTVVFCISRQQEKLMNQVKTEI